MFLSRYGRYFTDDMISQSETIIWLEFMGVYP